MATIRRNSYNFITLRCPNPQGTNAEALEARRARFASQSDKLLKLLKIH
jgi:hypothetical protein